VLGPDPYRVVYAQPSRRPADGRYGENPNRLYKHTQLQVILKPAPDNAQDLYLESLATIGINLKEHDVRFEEDNWEAPTLGAWGIGWQVLLDGLEITQFTYFQQSGGQNLDPISVELTYGLDRIAAYLQGVDNVFDVRWSNTTSYRQVRLAEEQQLSAYSFDFADAVSTRKQFELNEAEAKRILDAWPKSETPMLERFPILAAYELTLKCSHLFNLLDARGAISVTERAAMIGRVRKLAVRVAELWLRQRSGTHLAPELAGAQK
jgi:glycyl-tRNA synthetase alpha chain